MSKTPAAHSMDDLLDHEYDGIREYDNPCPGWWQWIFFFTFVFALAYFFYFHVGHAGITVEKSYENAVANNLRLRFAEIGELKLDEPTLLKYMHEPEYLKVGRSVFEQNCQQCHGSDGQGLVGPNLTDDFYKNVTNVGDILNVVKNGAANGSMPAWGRLHPNEILLVSAYVATLRGENLPGPRGPEGKKIPPWPTYEPGGDEQPDAGAGKTESDAKPQPPNPDGHKSDVGTADKEPTPDVGKK